MKKFLHIRLHRSKESGELARTQSPLYKCYERILICQGEDILISDFERKIRILERLNLELSQRLVKRSKPPEFRSTYTSVENLVVKKNVFGIEYFFLQGHGEDNQILNLLNLRLLVEKRLETNTSIECKFIDAVSEVFSN